jgi:ribonucleoside-triphosphate reductase
VFAVSYYPQLEVAMSHGATQAAHQANGLRRITAETPLEEITAEWSCAKRDGKVVPFDVAKIRSALRKCFASQSGDPVDVAGKNDATIEKIARAVINVLAAQQKTRPEVEEVQRLVIQQLWVEGLFLHAERYQEYREAHRRKRLTREVLPETQARFAEMRRHFPADVQAYQFMSKFSRWNEELRRRETWREAVYDRVVPWLQGVVRWHGTGGLTEGEWAELSDAMYGLEAHPAMRVLQMAGPALDRCHVGVYNCAYSPMADLFSLPEMLYVLMQGTGHGFSVESRYIDDLPRVKKQRGGKLDTIVVPDHTEGWCDSYMEGLQRWVDGYDVWYDTLGVRRKGTRLKTKGGRASGPEPFLELMTFTRNVILARQGRCLEDTDVHRLACFTGRIVQVGGVRRSSAISLSDLDSLGMRNIKSGEWWSSKTLWHDGRYLSMANNSAVYEERPTCEKFMEEWLALVKSKAGERGIFNRQAVELHKPARRKSAVWGANPCCEIMLRPFGFCNLTIAVARFDDTVETLKRKVRLATVFGVIQSLCTKFNYIRPEWRKNAEEERLLGVDITGHADCPLLRYGAPGRDELLRQLKAVVDETARPLSARFGINYSAANTCVKPSGDSSLFFNCASGISPWFSSHILRYVREQKETPVSKFLIDCGVPYADAPEAPDAMYVFGFPRQAPPGATTRHDMTARDQFFNWLEWKQNWAEHSVSATIYVDDHEWLELGHLVYQHFDEITGLSFLPRDNGRYVYPPNEEMTGSSTRTSSPSSPKSTGPS